MNAKTKSTIMNAKKNHQNSDLDARPSKDKEPFKQLITASNGFIIWAGRPTPIPTAATAGCGLPINIGSGTG
jgi:hypothetical protein